MSKRSKKYKDVQLETSESSSSSFIENKEPIRQYPSFEAFWAANVKNAKDIHLASCKAHLQSLGVLYKPEEWAKAIKHFGIKVEE